MRSFLLQTAILDRLNGPLCDAVTGQEEGHARLEALERGNFFVVPLDEKRHWFRYHHLFADVLHMHLMTEQPDQVARSIGAQVSGMRTMGCPPMRFATRWPLRISSVRRTWSSWPCQP